MREGGGGEGTRRGGRAMMYTVERNFGIPARRDFFVLTLNARGAGGPGPGIERYYFIFV